MSGKNVQFYLVNSMANGIRIKISSLQVFQERILGVWNILKVGLKIKHQCCIQIKKEIF